MLANLNTQNPTLQHGERNKINLIGPRGPIKNVISANSVLASTSHFLDIPFFWQIYQTRQFP